MKRNGWDFVLFYLGGVVVKCQLWLSELVTLAGHVTCTWSRTNVSFISCHIILSAVTSTNMFIGNPCP